MSLGGFAHPLPVLVGIDSGSHPLAVAWSAAIYHRPELIPVYGAEIVMAARFIPLEVGVGYCQFEMVPLRHRDVDKPLDILRLLRYPTQNVVSNESQIGTGAHSDFDCFTILWQDPNGGLQALNREGVWINAPPVDGTMLINVGDMMERWTNGKFVSTVHRVINRSGRERYSMVFFVAPNYSTRIECIPSCYVTGMPSKYRPISAGDYIVTRYNEVIV